MEPGKFDVTEIRRILSERTRYQITDESLRKAGVLIIIYPDNSNSYSLVLTKRTATLSNHKGEPSFPGGRYNPKKDNDIIDTALRESNEEIGIDTSNIEILGLLDDICTISGYIVTPVVGVANAKLHFVKNDAEVDKIFVVPMDLFLDKQNFTESFSRLDSEWFPVYFFKHIDEDGQRNDIWGATAHIIVQFMKTLYSYNPSESGLKRYTPERIKRMHSNRIDRNLDDIYKHLNK
jgi:8-oxo-dGTP pyrophosphatase MutT (NUDIX family)